MDFGFHQSPYAGVPGRVLQRLYEEAVSVDPLVRARAESEGVVETNDRIYYSAMSEAFMPVTPEFGKLLYVLARARGARRIVEFGTSLGISAIFLALALRDNGGGTLITTEREQEKAERAREHLRGVGLLELVEIRIGDATETLASVTGPIDLVFLDGAKRLYRNILMLLAPALRERSLVLSDNSEMDGLEDYFSYISDPQSGFATASIETDALGSRYGHKIVMRL